MQLIIYITKRINWNYPLNNKVFISGYKQKQTVSRNTAFCLYTLFLTTKCVTASICFHTKGLHKSKKIFLLHLNRVSKTKTVIIVIFKKVKKN